MAYLTPISKVIDSVRIQINTVITQVWKSKRAAEKTLRKELIAYKLAKTVYLVEQKRISPWSALQYGVNELSLLGATGFFSDSQKIDQLTNAITAANNINNQINQINALTAGLTSDNATVTISSINGILNSINQSASIIQTAGTTISNRTLPTVIGATGATGPTVNKDVVTSLYTVQTDISSVGADLNQLSNDLQTAGITNSAIAGAFNGIQTTISNLTQVTNSINNSVKTFNKISSLFHLGASGPIQTKRKPRNAPIQLPPELDPTNTIYFKLLVDLRNLLESLHKAILDLDDALIIIL